MAVLGVLIAIACLVVLGMGIVFGIVAAIGLTVFVALGIISSSTAIGLVRKSSSAGLLSLALQTGAALGVIAGLAASLVAALIMYDTFPPMSRVLSAGVIGGLFAGLGVGWVVYFGCTTIARWLWDRVEIQPATTALGTPRP